MDIIIGSPLSERQIGKAKEFLARLSLDWEENPDTTVNVLDEGKVIATGSRHKNILKCIGASCNYRGEGLATTIVTELLKDALNTDYSHLFIYTKPENAQTFAELGFYTISQTAEVALLENRKNGIKDFIENIPKHTGTIGGIIVNCNPFTKGHQYLMETASTQCDHVYVFVLSEDQSEFPANVRIELVRQGTAHIKNLSIHPTGTYQVSSATFPQYFLKDKANFKKSHCEIDVKIFAEYFAKELRITKRFIGTEPFSPITFTYNNEIKKLLPPYGIEVVELTRKEIDDQPVSASRVRKLIQEKNFDDIKKIVPISTYEYIIKNF